MSHFDLFIIGGGINGCGIAREAAGRGLVTGLAEMGDLAQGTSSASTKLVHGGLRYLEQYEFALVREALQEREVLLQIAPHLVRPMRFILPHVAGMRPKWMLRLGLFLYDHIAGRISLPGSHSVDFSAGVHPPLQQKFTSGFEYSDCSVDDARLVIANARDAARHGADIHTRTKVTSARRIGGQWEIALQPQQGPARIVTAAILVNAAGPWADSVSRQIAGVNHAKRIRLVQGAHIVTRKLFDHDKAYIFQNSDGRIIFAIPFERDFTLIGTTDTEFDKDPGDASALAKEVQYLIDSVNACFRRQTSVDEIVWRFGGVRALVDAGAGKAQSASREYQLETETGDGQAILLSVLGGKITSYRSLAEHVMRKLARLDPGDSRLQQKSWTGNRPLPGGDLPPEGLAGLANQLPQQYNWLETGMLSRWITAYGSEMPDLCAFAEAKGGPGNHFGSGLYAAEVDWLMRNEWALTADDILWRRSKLGLQFSPGQVAALDQWMAQNREQQ